MAEGSLTGVMALVEEDAEGLPCFHCGEIAWLKQFRLVVNWDTGGRLVMEELLCGACANACLEAD